MPAFPRLPRLPVSLTALFSFYAPTLSRPSLPHRNAQQMEKFKACEMEMKTKAFSKEGLIQAARLDPKEQEKEEAIQWVNNQVEQLQQQVEGTEAELEALQGTGKKRNKGGQTNAGRQEELEALNERRKWHISRLEIVLRLLNNGSLAVEKVNELKEDVEYFVTGNSVCGAVWIFFFPLKFFRHRRRTLKKMRVSTRSSIWTRRKRSLASWWMTTIVRILMTLVQVRIVCFRQGFPLNKKSRYALAFVKET